ncbi:MAG: hypothetical protein HRT45_08175, partial [Bdellovibrionales bacterium]|nr:hypothetical protein [Bdellovibrionales bacterium]
MSQRQFADLFGVAPGTISLWEKSQRQVPGPAQRLVELLEQSQQINSENSMKQIDSSRFRRVFKTGAALGKAGRQWLSSRMVPWYRSRDAAIQARNQASEGILLEFVKTMAELRGLNLKIIQMLSMMREDLPAGIRDFVANYQSELKPLAVEQVIQIFKSDFGQSPAELFDEFDLKPFAFGSISQVHKAKLQGQSLAVKVQYPGIAKALKSDLGNLDSLAKFFAAVMGFQGTDAMVRELREHILQECDYEQEAKNFSHFSAVFEGEDWVVVPKVFADRCSTHILSLEYFEGQSFEQVCESEDQSEKDRFGQMIFRFNFESIYKHHVFNADPHPGNYKLTDGKLALLDFGCVRRFQAEEVEKFRR